MQLFKIVKIVCIQPLKIVKIVQYYREYVHME